MLDSIGERGRNRTFNLLIKSQLLCQLSYAPDWMGNSENVSSSLTPSVRIVSIAARQSPAVILYPTAPAAARAIAATLGCASRA